MGGRLLEPDIDVPVQPLQAHDLVTDACGCHAIARELLVGRFGIMLLRLDELMVEVKVIFLAGLQPVGGNQRIHKELVEPVCRVEIVRLAAVGSVGGACRAQLAYRPENGVGTAGAKARVEREVVLQVRSHILHA